MRHASKTLKQTHVPCKYGLPAKGNSPHARVRDGGVDVSFEFLTGMCNLAGRLWLQRRRYARCAAVGLHALLETRPFKITCSWILHFRSATSCLMRKSALPVSGIFAGGIPLPLPLLQQLPLLEICCLLLLLPFQVQAMCMTQPCLSKVPPAFAQAEMPSLT